MLARYSGRAFFKRIADKTCQAVFASSLYKLTLWGPTPKSIEFLPEAIWKGDTYKGDDIIAGRFTFERSAPLVSIDPWAVETDDPAQLEHLHSFHWLRDLAEAEDQIAARSRVQTLIEDWISNNEIWSPLPWRPDILGERITLWFEYYDQLFATGGNSFRRLVVKSLSRQLKHLNRVAHIETIGIAKLTALKGLICGAACLPGGGKRLPSLYKTLEREIERHILDDGSYINRNPSSHHTALTRLVEIRSIIKGRQLPSNNALEETIQKMAPVLRFFRHPDGGLSQFNGSVPGDTQCIDRTLIRAAARTLPPRILPISRYNRLLVGKILVLFDIGSPPPVGYDDNAHAGTLSIEVSIGRERLFVNCGAIIGTENSWKAVQRTTAAHSTLTIEDRNSSELLASGGLGSRRAKVIANYEEDDDYFISSARHDGYCLPFSTVHSRTLRLAKNSERLEGVDELTCPDNRRFNIRFHLHPQVSASVSHSGKSAILRLPKGGGWQLDCNGGNLRLDESIYLDGVRAKRSVQIVFEGDTEQEKTVISWALHSAVVK